MAWSWTMGQLRRVAQLPAGALSLAVRLSTEVSCNIITCNSVPWQAVHCWLQLEHELSHEHMMPWWSRNHGLGTPDDFK